MPEIDLYAHVRPLRQLVQRDRVEADPFIGLDLDLGAGLRRPDPVREVFVERHIAGDRESLGDRTALAAHIDHLAVDSRRRLLLHLPHVVVLMPWHAGAGSRAALLPDRECDDRAVAVLKDRLQRMVPIGHCLEIVAGQLDLQASFSCEVQLPIDHNAIDLKAPEQVKCEVIRHAAPEFEDQRLQGFLFVDIRQLVGDVQFAAFVSPDVPEDRVALRDDLGRCHGRHLLSADFVAVEFLSRGSLDDAVVLVRQEIAPVCPLRQGHAVDPVRALFSAVRVERERKGLGGFGRLPEVLDGRILRDQGIRLNCRYRGNSLAADVVGVKRHACRRGADLLGVIGCPPGLRRCRFRVCNDFRILPLLPRRSAVRIPGHRIFRSKYPLPERGQHQYQQNSCHQYYQTLFHCLHLLIF